MNHISLNLVILVAFANGVSLKNIHSTILKINAKYGNSDLVVPTLVKESMKYKKV